MAAPDKANRLRQARARPDSASRLPMTTARTEPDGERPAHFREAREAKARVLLEDYVELIAELAAERESAVGPSRIARHLGVSHASAIKCIGRLCRAGLAETQPYRGVSLTEAGQVLAETVKRRHQIVLDVLAALGVPDESAQADAEGIEHHVSQATLDAFERFLATSPVRPGPDDPRAAGRAARGSGDRRPVSPHR